MKASAIAHPNIAFVKYWGKYNDKLYLPMNGSISLTLNELTSQTTVEFGNFKADQITLNKNDASDDKKILKQLDLIRQLAGITKRAKVVSNNNFPTASGLASSASGLAALTVAACKAAGLDYDKKQLSIITRQGSGSSCRSIYGGYVEWRMGASNDDSYAIQLADENYWDIRDIIAIVANREKKVKSTVGMEETVKTCPLYQGRLAVVNHHLAEVRAAITERDFKRLGEVAEYDSLMMHATMIATKPSLLYWAPGTVAIIHAIGDWRAEGLPVYHTIDAGANVHVITLPENAAEVEKRLRKVEGVNDIIHCRPGGDANLIEKHLF